MSMSMAQKKFRKLQSGFTLVELLVTITIFVILTGVVLFSQAKFNSTILLTNLAYDTALTIRQAQTFGINIKNFNVLGADKFTPYGVHFDMSANKSFILFADLDSTLVNNQTVSDGLYDSSTPGGQAPDLTLCQDTMGCVNRYNITRGNLIDSLCKDTGNGSCFGDPDKSVNSLDIVFQRPNPDALITANGSTVLTSARIVLKNPSDSNIKEIVVQSNGLIYIKSQ